MSGGEMGSAGGNGANARAVRECLGLLVAAASTSASADPLQQTLISVGRNIDVPTWEVTSREATPDCPIPWSVRKMTLHGGKQEGVEVLIVDNGKLRFAVCPTRGMGLLRGEIGDVRLGWDSPVKETVHPKFVNLLSRGGLGWLEGFNEWMVRCGMEYAGHPGTDKFINNVGDEATMDLTLHGRLGNLPAQEVAVLIDRAAPWRIRVCGRVDERMFYGPKLELATEISTEPGSAALRIADLVTNRGDQAQEFEMIYHTNFGRPLLEEGAAFLSAVERVTPFNARAAEGLATYAQYGGPQPGFIEQVYCLRLLADKDGRTVAVLANKARDRAFSMTYAVKELPCFTLWKNTLSEKEGYVTGLEPGTNFPANRRVERQYGRVRKLAPGASQPFTFDYAVHIGPAEVKAEADRVAAIQAGRTPTIDEQPEKKD